MLDFGIALKQKSGTEGLTRNEIVDLYDMLAGKQVFPLELEAHCAECSAMGFISVDAAEILDYDYEKSSLHDYIASILEDINLEDEDSEYDFKGIHVWLSY